MFLDHILIPDYFQMREKGTTTKFSTGKALDGVTTSKANLRLPGEGDSTPFAAQSWIKESF